MKVEWTAKAKKDALYWHNKDPKIYQKIKNLISEIEQTPFTGTGSPEPLKHNLKGWWSRRLTQEHRLVYRVSGKTPQKLEIASCKGHY